MEGGFLVFRERSRSVSNLVFPRFIPLLVLLHFPQSPSRPFSFISFIPYIPLNHI